MPDQTPAPAADVIVAPTHVAAFGCPGTGRLFRALVPGRARRDNAASTLTIPRCPGCGGEHGVLHMGRDRRAGESIDVCIDGAVDLGPPPKPTPPPSTKPTPAADFPDHRQRFSDDDIRALLTAEPQRAAAVARALGARQSSTIVERCRKLADARVIEQGQGRPILVQLDQVKSE
jgi:hypothetical protein